MTEGHSWSDWLEVGEPELDNDHHLQMRLVSALIDALEEGRPWLAHRLSSHLQDSSTVHFESEEQRMRSSGDPDRVAHQKEHDELLDRMEELVELVDVRSCRAPAGGADGPKRWSASLSDGGRPPR
jgi:hemerythrin